jgi:hypothetical protein
MSPFTKKFTQLSLIIVTLICLTVLGLAAMAFGKVHWTAGRFIFFYAAPAIIAACAVFTLRKPISSQMLLLGNLGAIAIAIYAAQAYFIWEADQDILRHYQAVGKRMGYTVDEVDKLGFIQRENKAGRDLVLGGISSSIQQPVQISGKNILVYTDQALRNVAICKNAKWFTFPTDEYGFNNPRGIWPNERLDAVFLGDSFTQGWCLERRLNFVDLVRQHAPLTASAAIGGIGPLKQYYLFSEYVAKKKPKVLFWVYFENDLPELNKEKDLTYLKNYFDRELFFDLPSMQSAINKIIQSAQDTLTKNVGSGENAKSRLVDLILLRELRSKLFLSLHTMVNDEAPPIIAISAYKKIFQRVLDRVRSWGGRVVVIYLPSVQYFSGGPSTPSMELRPKVLSMYNRLGVDVIDMHEVFNRHKSPFQQYFFSNVPAHYTPEGNQAIATEVLNYFKQTGAH